MRLIGGNISDTPVKEVGDGSAFNVGGAAGAPDLIGIGTFGAATALTQFVDDPGEGSSDELEVSTIKWADNSYGIFKLNELAVKMTYMHLQTNADGTFLSEGTEVDISSNFTTASTTQGKLKVKKLSASRVVIAYGIPHATHKFELGVFDKSGDTVSLVGSVLSRNTTYNNYAALDDFTLGVLGTDANTVCVFLQDGSTNTVMTAIPANVVTNTGFGTAVTQAATSSQYSGSAHDTYTSTGGVIHHRVHERKSQWTLTAGTTPSVAYTRAGVYEGNYNYTYMPQGDPSFLYVADDDTEAGRHVHTGSTNTGIWWYTGTTSVSVYKSPMEFPPQTTGIKAGGLSLQISHDSDTGWSRCLYVCGHTTTNTGTYVVPYNVNFITGEIKLPSSSEYGYSTNFQMLTGKLMSVMHGNDSATNIVIIGHHAGTDERYMNVAITL